MAGAVKKFGNFSVTVIMEGDNAWFRGKDVALALGYKRPSKAIADHVPKDDKRVKPTLKRSGGLGNDYNAFFINESGMKRLVLKSRMPNAQDIAEALGIDIYNSKVLYKEQESISAIQKAFDSERMITQYAVGIHRWIYTFRSTTLQSNVMSTDMRTGMKTRKQKGKNT